MLGLTSNGDLGRPLGRPLEHSLFGTLQVSAEVLFGELEHVLDELEHLGSVLLADLHPLLHGHDNVLGFILRAMLRAFLDCTWIGKRTHTLEQLCFNIMLMIRVLYLHIP